MNETSHCHHCESHGHRDTQHATDADAKVRDPVCGMMVDPATAKHHAQHAGADYYFCSANCAAKFANNPTQYLEPRQSAPAAAAAGTIYTCPMHPEIRQPKPGHCPICGMALEPLVPTLEADDTSELDDFSRRFWWTLPLTLAVFVLAMAGHRLNLLPPSTQSWVELVLATPVVLWGA